MLDNTESSLPPHDQLRKLLRIFIGEFLRYDTSEILRVLKREDLSMPRIAALNIVERKGVASISEISAGLALSLGNTSMIIDKLVCSSLVTRVEDSNDRRQKLVRLTESGTAIVEEFRSLRIEAVMERMRELPPDVLERLTSVLDEALNHVADTTTNSGT